MILPKFVPVITCRNRCVLKGYFVIMRFENAYNSSHVCKQDINTKLYRRIILATVISKP